MKGKIFHELLSRKTQSCSNKQVVYKKLKGQQVSSLSDLMEFQPALAKGLQQLLDFDGDVEAAFGFTFQLSFEVMYSDVSN